MKLILLLFNSVAYVLACAILLAMFAVCAIAGWLEWMAFKAWRNNERSH